LADTITLPGTGAIVATDEVTFAAVLQHFQRMKLFDGTDGGTVPVAALTTAPVGTEGGLVVRPISSGVQTIQGQQTALQSGSIIAATTVIGPFTATGYNLATVGIAGTYAGVTAVFEGTPDGTNWFTLQGQQTDTGAVGTGPVALTNTVRAWDVFIGGWTQVRVRATAWTSGSATILVTFQTMPTEPVPTTGLYGIPLTPASPTVNTVGVASAQAVAANANRKGLVLTNVSGNVISLGLGVAAVLNSGISLMPNGGVFVMDPFTFSTAVVNAIAAAASSTLGIQEFS
jgi:hypothetical protein